VGQVTTMDKMFFDASAFNQALCWSHTGKPTTDMFVLSSGSANANQSKCSCVRPRDLLHGSVLCVVLGRAVLGARQVGILL